MSAISPVNSFAPQQASVVSPNKKTPITYEERAKKEQEQAVIIAKQKPDSERNWKDYMVLALDSIEKLSSVVVVHANEANNLDYKA